jgi:hypothetical protein
LRYWIRKSELTLGENRFSLDDLNYKFKVNFEDSAKISKAEIEIYNLSLSTQNSLKKGDQIILTAGYQGDVGSIFIGSVFDFVNDRRDLDTITTITGVDSMDAWLGTNINKSYKPGMWAADILDDLLNIFGVEVSMINLTVNKYYPGSRVCKGKLKDVLTEIVCSDCKSRLAIRTGQIIINPPNEGITTGFLLTPETGLLKAASAKELQKINNSTSPEQVPYSEQSDPNGTLSRACLLNYHIGAADVITLLDSQVYGDYRVTSGVHEGSRSGAWKTTLEVTPV